MNPAHMQIRAFPSHGTMGEVIDPGMLLRDYFAAKAMQALVARDAPLASWTDIAAHSYHVADAMLGIRDKT